MNNTSKVSKVTSMVVQSISQNVQPSNGDTTDKSKELKQQRVETNCSIGGLIDNIGEGEDRFSKFSLDLMEKILSKVFAMDPGALGIIRLICKSWCSIPRPPTFLINIKYHESPYLVSLNDSTCKFFHPYYSHSFDLDIPELADTIILYSKCGWLLLSRYINIRDNGYESYFENFFFNPFTRQKIMLPRHHHQFESMCFSSNPSSPDCYVVGVEKSDYSLAIHKCGGDDWTCFRIAENELEFVYYCHPIIHKQKFLFMRKDKKIIMLNLNHQSPSPIVISNIFPKQVKSFYTCSFVENEKELLMVCGMGREKIPYVIRMDESRRKILGIRSMMWHPMQNLDNRMIFVSPVSSFSLTAPTISTKNKIFFHYVKDDECLFYSPCTKEYHSFSGNYKSNVRKVACKAERLTNCAWINPTI